MNASYSQAIGDLYAVMGDPIAHSASPLIHQAFAQQTGQSIRYERLLVTKEQFSQAVTEFIERGGCGLSITMPLKQLAYEFVDECDAAADRAKAVNNIIITPEKKLIGVNTDGIGLVNDIQNNFNIDLCQKKILILGAGGAVRGLLYPLLQQQPTQIILANRTLNKAEQLATDFSTDGNIIACAYDHLAGKTFDIIINSTARGVLPPLPTSIAPALLCYDLNYGQVEAPFIQWAKAQKAQITASGFGMLVEQGAEIFRLWRGVKPQTQPIMAQLMNN